VGAVPTDSTRKVQLILDKIRDGWTTSYTYFWRSDEKGRVISPFFDSETDARKWIEQNLADGVETVSTGQ
jgi:hypothetical protein